MPEVEMVHAVYLGWDPNETVAYDVARESIRKRASIDVTVAPIRLTDKAVGSILTRPIECRPDGKLWCPISQAPMSTEFAISRFCVPWLHRKGFALFADCDVLCLGDIAELFSLADPKYAVQVVKHNQQPTEQVKMGSQVQTAYPRKNWSSVVLWNCDHDAHLRFTVKELNEWPGRDLHAFKWLRDEEIGELLPEWNYLVGVSPVMPVVQMDKAVVEHGAAKLLHYTLGGPWIPGWKGGPLDDVWYAEAASLLH